MKLKILIVDDEPDITKLLGNFLTLENYDVETSNNPLEAFEKVQKGKYHIVITDIMMPEMNGVDLIREIRKVDGMIQIIAITGYVTIHNVLSAFRLGATNMFFKPFENLDDILGEVKLAERKLNRINEILRERQAQNTHNKDKTAG